MSTILLKTNGKDKEKIDFGALEKIIEKIEDEQENKMRLDKYILALKSGDIEQKYPNISDFLLLVFEAIREDIISNKVKKCLHDYTPFEGGYKCNLCGFLHT